MRYNIHGFSQSVATKLGLTNDDLLILRWFVDFSGTNRMKTMIEDDGIYYWITYSKILEDLPILKVSKDRIKKKHFNKLCEAGVLKHKHIKQGGSFSYFALGNKYLSLIAKSDSIEEDIKGSVENNVGGRSKITEGSVENDQTKITLLNNNSINNNKVSKKGKNDKTSFDLIIDDYTNDEEVKEWLKEWLKVRKVKRAAMTDKAIELNLKKLDKLANESNLSVIDYLQEVIIRGWGSFFKINNYEAKEVSNGVNTNNFKDDTMSDEQIERFRNL